MSTFWISPVKTCKKWYIRVDWACVPHIAMDVSLLFLCLRGVYIFISEQFKPHFFGVISRFYLNFSEFFIYQGTSLCGPSYHHFSTYLSSLCMGYFSFHAEVLHTSLVKITIHVNGFWILHYIKKGLPYSTDIKQFNHVYLLHLYGFIFNISTFGPFGICVGVRQATAPTTEGKLSILTLLIKTSHFLVNRSHVLIFVYNFRLGKTFQTVIQNPVAMES